MATFIKYILPGSFFMDEHVVHCPKGEQASAYAVANAPAGAFAFMIGKRNEDQVNPTWYDGTTYIKGEVLGVEAAVALGKSQGLDMSILEGNCRANGYKRLVKLPSGQYLPFGASDTML